MTAKTLYQKLVDAHTVTVLDQENVLLFCDLHLMNEYTSPQAFAGLKEKGYTVPVPGQNVAVVSHIIPTHHTSPRIIADPASALQAVSLKKNCDKYLIPIFDTNDALQGIEHVVSPEHGMIRPGMVVICGDSHTTTYGDIAQRILERCGGPDAMIAAGGRVSVCDLTADMLAIGRDRAKLDRLRRHARDTNDTK